MALLFTEIVNQLNALSCLHGDDDDDAGDGGFLKQARKAAAKPSSQGLCSSFFHLLPSVSDFVVNVASSALLFIPMNFVILNPFIFQLYSHLPCLLFCDGVKIH